LEGEEEVLIAAPERVNPAMAAVNICCQLTSRYEAAAAIRDWAHERPNIDRLVSLISPDDVRSQRIAERLGAIPTETVTPAHSKRTTVVWTYPPIV
jgi:hypothetical protein